MAQRKSPPSSRSGRPSTGKTSTRPATGGTASRTSPTSKASAASRPPRKPTKNKSIVNQKQTPWGLIITTILVVLFAAGVVVAVVVTHKSSTGNVTSSLGGQPVSAADPYRQPELAAATNINGITYKVEGQHTHVAGSISYDSSPPVGGDHSPYWADCTGTVYAQPIANENAVHMLEHGAVWITYNAKTLPAAQLAILKKDVAGINYLALSPYPDLKTPISLQAWGYQLFVNNASDPRIKQFITLLRSNPKTTPENNTCSDPSFKQHPSTFGHPLEGPGS